MMLTGDREVLGMLRSGTLDERIRSLATLLGAFATGGFLTATIQPWIAETGSTHAVAAAGGLVAAMIYEISTRSKS
jgi:hypothetical protein